MASSLYISDDFKTLETYFFDDTISQANDLIAEMFIYDIFNFYLSYYNGWIPKL